MTLSAQNVVFISLLLDLFAFTIPLPLFPRLVQWYISKEHGSQGLTARTLNIVGRIRSFLLPNSTAHDNERWDTVLLGGLMGSLFSALQCIVSPHLGQLSDKYGRKPVLLVTMLGNVFSALIWVQSTGFASFLLSRAVGGLSEGNVQLSIAIISDVSTQEHRSRDLSLVGIAFAICFCIGPPIGAWFSTHPLPPSFLHNTEVNIYATPALLSLVLLLLEIVLLVVALPETRPRNPGKPEALSAQTKAAVPAVTRAPVAQRRAFLKQLGRFHFGFLALFSGVEFTLTFLSFDLFDWNNAQNGRLLMVIGIISALLQGGYVRRVKFREAILARRGVFSAAFATAILAILPIISDRKTGAYLLYISATFLAFTSATVVNSLNAIASMQCDDVEDGTENASHPELAKGRALGKHRAAGQLGRALGPVLACVAYWTVGPTITYATSAAAMTALFIQMRASRQLGVQHSRKEE